MSKLKELINKSPKPIRIVSKIVIWCVIFPIFFGMDLLILIANILEKIGAFIYKHFSYDMDYVERWWSARKNLYK